MKYLKIKKVDSNYNFYTDNDIETDTNLITTDTHPAGALKLFKGINFTGQRNINYQWVNRTIATNKKDLTNQDIISTSSAGISYSPTARYKVVNNKLFVVNSSGGITNITDNVYTGTYTDLCYYNGYYYLVKNDNKIYRTEDFITFDTYITTDINYTWKFITNIGSKFYGASGNSWSYSDIKVWRIKNDGTSVMLTQAGHTETLNGIGHLDTIDNNVVAVAQYNNSYLEVFRNIQDDGTCDSYASDTYSNYYNNLSYDEINNELYYSVSNKVIKFNFSNNTFSYFTVIDNYSTIPYYHKFNGNLIGTNCILDVYDNNSKKLDDGSIVYDIDAYDNDYCKVKVLPALNYKLDSVTSLNGTVTYDEQETIIEYASDDLYLEDTITVATSFNLFVPSGDYELTSISTSDFESDEFSNSFIYYEGSVISIDKMKAENNKFYVRDALSSEWLEIYDGATLTWKTGSNVFMLGDNVTNVSNGVKTSFENGTQVSPIINYNINYEKNSNMNLVVEKGYKLNITGEHYFIVDRENFKIKLNTVNGTAVDNVVSDKGTITYTKDVSDNNISAKIDLSGLDGNEVTITFLIIDSKLKFVLYDNTDEVKEVRKTLTDGVTIYGNLTENAIIENPSLVLEIDVKDLINYNYIYIPQLKRYYFIDDYETIATGLTRVYCNEDKLVSFSNAILNSKANIIRSSYGYDAKLVDDLIPKKAQLNITETELTTIEWSSGKYKEFRSDVANDGLTPLQYNVTVTIANAIATADLDHTITKVSVTGDAVLPANVSYAPVNQKTFVLKTPEELDIFLNWVNTIEGGSSYILGARIYPFNLLNNMDNTYYGGIVVDGYCCKGIGFDQGGTAQICLDINYPAVMIFTADYYKYTTYSFTAFTDYLDIKAKYELYVPYASWINLNGQQINGKTINITYAFDVNNGRENVFITDITSSKLIYSAEVSVSIDVPINFDSSAEIERKKDALYTSSILNLLGGGSALATGVVMQNPLAVAGGALSIGKTFANYFQSMDALFVTAQCSTGDAILSLFLPKKCRLRITKEIEQYSTDWIKQNGKPVQKVDTISNYHGFVQAELKDKYIAKATKKEVEEIKRLLLEGVYIKQLI